MSDKSVCLMHKCKCKKVHNLFCTTGAFDKNDSLHHDGC